MNRVKEMIDINPDRLDEYVVRTLLYYDIFNYPLRGREVFRFLGINSVAEQEVERSLNKLVDQQYLFRFGDLYSVQSSEANIERRLKGNHEAARHMALAKSRARFIAQFPFVRAVMASGSLSKGYMDEKSDLDFFIVTHPGRLWVARMLLVMYKRIFLFNSHKYFCVNYFVDHDHLEIEEKNIFTATELATLIPLYGKEYYDMLLASNGWMKKIFPNYKPRPTNDVPASRHGGFKKILEALLNIPVVNKLDAFFMFLTLRRWKKMYQNEYAKTDFEVAFKTRKHTSKTHPYHYQKKVTERYEEKLANFATRFDWKWHE